MSDHHDYQDQTREGHGPITGADRISHDASRRMVAVAGATGSVGAALVRNLLREGHMVRVLARNAEHVNAFDWATQVDVVEGDVRDSRACARLLDGVSSANYLVHGLDAPDSPVDTDVVAAITFARAASTAGIDQIVYLGGPFPSSPVASEYLLTRNLVGEIFLASGVPAIVLRSSAIIGPRSAPWDLLRAVCESLPVIPLPLWADNRLEPIWLGDVVRSLTHCITLAGGVNDAFDLPGPEILSYRQMIQIYLKVTGLHRRLARLPWISTPLIALTAPLISPISARACRRLVASGPPDLLSDPQRQACVLGDVFRARRPFAEAVHALTGIVDQDTP